jgi:glutathione S-transferase
MQLIGMLDSPYVRRVAISLHLLNLPFVHRPISVFRDYPEFSQINPAVKAPSLVCDNGVVLMDSTLILDYVEAAAGRSLMSADLAQRQQELRILGLALAACEKSVQLVYERELRPTEKQHEPWITRVGIQMERAYATLEAELAGRPLPADSAGLTQADLTTAVCWRFTELLLPGRITAAEHPALARLSDWAEQQPAFQAAPPN